MFDIISPSSVHVVEEKLDGIRLVIFLKWPHNCPELSFFGLPYSTSGCGAAEERYIQEEENYKELSRDNIYKACLFPSFPLQIVFNFAAKLIHQKYLGTATRKAFPEFIGETVFAAAFRVCPLARRRNGKGVVIVVGYKR